MQSWTPKREGTWKHTVFDVADSIDLTLLVASCPDLRSWSTVSILDVYCFFPVLESLGLRQTIKARCSGLLTCLVARNVALNFPSFCRFPQKTLKFNKTTYKPLCVPLLTPFFATHQVGVTEHGVILCRAKNQEVSEYGSVYGSKLWKCQFSVGSQLGTQLRSKPPQSSSEGTFFVRIRFGGVPSTVEEVVRVRFCCLLSWKTNTGNTGRTVLGHRPNKVRSSVLRPLRWLRIDWLLRIALDGLANLGSSFQCANQGRKQDFGDFEKAFRGFSQASPVSLHDTVP